MANDRVGASVFACFSLMGGGALAYWPVTSAQHFIGLGMLLIGGLGLLWTLGHWALTHFSSASPTLRREPTIAPIDVERSTRVDTPAGDTFDPAHRPQLVVHSERLLPEKGGSIAQQPPSAELVVVNAGTRDSAITESAVYLSYHRQNEKPRFLDLLRNDVVPPQPLGVGAATSAIMVKSEPADGERHAEALADAGFNKYAVKQGIEERVPIHTLYLSGWIKYAEPGTAGRTTYFRRIYDHRLERFVPSDDPDDEKTY